MAFLTALGQHTFLQYALVGGLLASVACGVVGSYVSARRITYVAGGIAHSVLGGMGVARYLQVTHGLQWLHPLYGAVAAALLAAVVIGLVSLRARQSEDTVISAIWAIGMATGVLFIWRTPGYGENLMSYLFGNILMITSQSLWLLVALDAVIVVVGVVGYRPLLALCFDEEFARLRGVNIEVWFLVLLCLTALTVVLLTTVVGLVMVIALLSLPVAIAERGARSLGQMMVLGGLLSALFTTAGLWVSYEADLPSGATAVVITGATYLLTLLGARVRAAMARRAC